MAATMYGNPQGATWDLPAPPVLRLVSLPPSRRVPVGVYRRRRLVAMIVVCAVLALVMQLAVQLLGASASAGTRPAPPVVLVAAPGDSYWTLAAQVHDGGDIRSTVDALVRANGGRELRAGDVVTVAP